MKSIRYIFSKMNSQIGVISFKKIGIMFACFLMHLQMQAGEIVLEGSYQGKNIYVQNPFTGSGVGFCVTEVTVNGELSTDEIQSSAFEIDLMPYRFQVGDHVLIKIKHKDDCTPRVINEEDLKVNSTFEITQMQVDEHGLRWSTKNESGPLPFSIEEFRWNRWTKIGEIAGKGNPENASYSFKIKLHSGIHKYRVSQKVEGSRARNSSSVEFKSNIPAVTYYPIKVNKDIHFSAETPFEIYDEYGNLLKSGEGNVVDVSRLAKGIYYLNFDNSTEKFIKK